MGRCKVCGGRGQVVINKSRHQFLRPSDFVPFPSSPTTNSLCTLPLFSFFPVAGHDDETSPLFCLKPNALLKHQGLNSPATAPVYLADPILVRPHLTFKTLHQPPRHGSRCHLSQCQRRQQDSPTPSIKCKRLLSFRNPGPWLPNLPILHERQARTLTPPALVAQGSNR